ncbi:MAG: hypothetical protein KA764_16505 [Anaerolineales bacterium]|nr:hypothetical protein [Anaerolineales bacterium]
MRPLLLGFSLGVILGAAACLTAPAAPTSTTAPTAAAPTRTAAASATTRPSLTPSQRPATATPPATATRPAATATAPNTATAPPTPAAVTPATVYITYQDFAILPAETIIRAGAPVVFLIKAGLFTFHQPYNFTAPNTFEAPASLGDGATYTHVFTEPGSVTLLCGYHPEMRAQLIVQP